MSQVVELITSGDILLDLFSDHVGKFVSVLNDSRNSDWSLPVGVIEALPVGELPEGILLQVCVVGDELIACRSGSTWGHILCDHFEVEAFIHDLAVHNGAWGGVFELLEEAMSDSLIDEDLGECWWVVFFECTEHLLDLYCFSIQYRLYLAFTDTISIEDYGIWEEAIDLLVLDECLCEVSSHVVS